MRSRWCISVMAGLYILGFWLPGMIKSYGVADPFHICLLTAVPYIASAVGERRWHLAGCMVVAAFALVACTLAAGNPLLGLVTLSVAAVGVYALDAAVLDHSFPLPG